MTRQKFDGVIEAVRYMSDGKIELVRAYERRGAAFSDRVLLDRATLLDKLQSGKRFVTGERQVLMANSFATGKPVRALGGKEKPVVSTAERAERDSLEEVPLF